ncbi:hypothetical protein Y032_0126g1320 [Ancylostoma ceylanicum]|nr:hypothetical protein Y032_0126g1320 [Ancylostoma ceylanicum]
MANDRSDSEKDDGVSGQENMRSVYLLPKKDLEPRQSQTRSVYLMPAVGVEESAKQTRVRRGSKENDEMYDEDSVHEKRKHKSKKKSKKSGSREDTEGRKSSTPSRDHSRKRVAHKYAKRHDKKPSSSDERDQVSSSKKRDKRKKKGRKRGSKEKRQRRCEACHIPKVAATLLGEYCTLCRRRRQRRSSPTMDARRPHSHQRRQRPTVAKVGECPTIVM